MVCICNGIIVFGHFGDKAWENGVPELALEIHWNYRSFGLLAIQFWAYEGIEGFKQLDQNQFNEYFFAKTFAAMDFDFSIDGKNFQRHSCQLMKFITSFVFLWKLSQFSFQILNQILQKGRWMFVEEWRWICCYQRSANFTNFSMFTYSWHTFLCWQTLYLFA